MPKTEESGYPSWLIPAGAGAVAVLALLVSGLIGYKIGLAQNPAAQLFKNIQENMEKNMQEGSKLKPFKPLSSEEFFKDMPESPLYKKNGKTK